MKKNDGYVGLVLFFFFQVLNAQIGTWNILNVQLETRKQLRFTGEVQLRSLLFYNHFHYYEYKGFIQKNWKNGLGVGLGVGNYQTYREGGNFITPRNVFENRISPQIITNQNFKIIDLEHRYRLEFRFTDRGFRNRFRYRVGLKGNIPKSPITLILNNEIFLGNRAPYFERNRFSFFIQYNLNPFINYQAGYLFQFDYRINDEIGRNFLVIAINFHFKRILENKAESLD